MERVFVGDFCCYLRGPENGRLAILCHGFPDGPLSFAHVQEKLADAGFRVCSPFMRGYGSSPSDGDFSALQLAHDIHGIAEGLGTQRPYFVVGHDWGAIAALRLALERPNAVQALVMMSVPHPQVFLRNATRSFPQLLRSSYMAAFQVPGVGLLLKAGKFAPLRKLWRRWSPGFQPSPAYQEHLAESLAPHWPAPLNYYRHGLKAMLRGEHNSEFSDTVEPPTLYLHGRQDGCIAASVADGQEPYFRQLQSVVVDKAGHFLQMEKPEDVAYQLIKWFKSNS